MKVKICGITRIEDALLACQRGAWAIGFIFYEKSPRYILPENAAKIVNEVKKNGFGVKPVGVFVDPTIADLRSVTSQVELKAIQLHGDETLSFCREVERELGVSVIKAVRPKSGERVPSDFDQGEFTILVDAFDKEARGGTGKLSNWSALQHLNKNTQVILSGGLNSTNVAQAIKTVSPFAVDLSSGVETTPGIKDPKKLIALFEEVNL